VTGRDTDAADDDAADDDEGGGSRTDEGRTADTPDRVSLLVRHAGGETTLDVRRGRILRDVLREHGLSPYTRLTERANCGGRGLCATCGVRLRTGPAPDHWHDRLADRFGYPRLSCQVVVEEGMVVELDEEKLVWGRRERASDE
jgi:ferredoxin